MGFTAAGYKVAAACEEEEWRMKHLEEVCLVCGKPLKYITEDEQMECVFCHRTFHSKAQCEDGHYICDECHAEQGIKTIREYCMSTKSKNPIEMMMEMMENPYIHMHGPEHHVMTGAALITAYYHAGGQIELEKALDEMEKRGRQVPGGVCGFWGSCGAGISAGMFMSIVTQATPLGKEEWGLSNRMTAKALEAIGEVGGPRCCKRNTFLAALEAVKFTEEKLGIKMGVPKQVRCTFIKYNPQCIGKRCPFVKKL